MGLTEVGRNHTEHLAAAAGQRRGLDRAVAGGVDDRRRAAGTGALLNVVEVIQEVLLETALRDDLQRMALRIVKLHVAEVGVEQGHRGFEHFLEQRLNLGVTQQPGTKLVQLIHRLQFSRQFVF